MFLETLFISIGSFILSSYIVWKRSRQQLLSEEAVFDLILLVSLVGVVSARFIFILFHFDAFGLSLFRWIVFIHYPGFSLIGGILGGLSAVWYFTRKSKLPLWDILDSSTWALLLVGALFSSLHVGIQLLFSSEWVVVQTRPVYEQLTSVIAMNAYAAIGLTALLSLLLFLEKKLRVASGYIGIGGLFGLALVLFLVDLLATTRVYYGWLTGEQIVTIIFGVIVLLLLIYRIKKKAKPTMISRTKKIWSAVESRLKKDEKRAMTTIKNLKKEDPFNDPNHALDNAASDTDAFEQNSHQRIESLTRSLRNRLGFIRGARTRLSKGKYGICEVCNKKIAPERLAIMPSATICISCEKKREKSSRK